MALVLSIDPDAPDPAVIETAARTLRAGGLVAFPTETVYGLGVHALDAEAVRRAFVAKGRPATDPLIVHVDRLEAVVPLVAELSSDALALAARFWPGPLTIVLRRSPLVPNAVTAGLDTVALRIPALTVARHLIAAAGIPVAAPSANLFSRPSPTRASHVLDDLADVIDVVLDGGQTQVGIESTVIDLSQDVPTILRPGAITLEMIRTVLPEARAGGHVAARGAVAMRAPGMLEKHYSPRAPLVLYEGSRDLALGRLLADAHRHHGAGSRVGLLAPSEDLAWLAPAVEVTWHTTDLGPAADAAVVATRLYASLRELDGAAVDVILARGVEPVDGLGVALTNRLRRAAAGRVVREPADDPS